VSSDTWARITLFNEAFAHVRGLPFYLDPGRDERALPSNALSPRVLRNMFAQFAERARREGLDDGDSLAFFSGVVERAIAEAASRLATR
jgi:hypothetical protein